MVNSHFEYRMVNAHFEFFKLFFINNQLFEFNRFNNFKINILKGEAFDASFFNKKI